MTRLRRLVSVLAVGCAIAIAAAGCHKKVPRRRPRRRRRPRLRPQPPPPPPPPPAPHAGAAAAPADRRGDLRAEVARAAERGEAASDVYFDLDKSDDSRRCASALLQKDADWMKKWTSTQITVEGHCDSRGSAEYNLALGSRRATAVKDYLVSLGVPPTASRWSARARSSRSAPKRTSRAGSRTAADTSSSRRSRSEQAAGRAGRAEDWARPSLSASCLSRPSRQQSAADPPPLTRYFAAFFPSTSSTGISRP